MNPRTQTVRDTFIAHFNNNVSFSPTPGGGVPDPGSGTSHNSHKPDT
jgi:hypothetical protein